MKFAKYQPLGNDYIIIEPTELTGHSAIDISKAICHRRLGVGSDGLLVGPQPSRVADFRLSIFNPDGSEAEKSGNGLRIFCKYLLDTHLVSAKPFTVETAGGIVTCSILDHGKSIRVEMGQPSFMSGLIGIAGHEREVIAEEMVVDGQKLTYCGVTIGNPHCVVLDAAVDRQTTMRLGPLIEAETRFLNRTNVQFLKIIDRNNIYIHIWERGAGYTLASGSSSVAAAAVARRLGLVDDSINVEMPGGRLVIEFDEKQGAHMSGPAEGTFTGRFDPEAMLARYP
jgi:diaminopimelate epimerase